MSSSGEDTVKRSFASAVLCVTRHHGDVRYFTRGLVNGEFSDDEEAQAKAEAAYAQRLEAISPSLPASVLKLAGLNLHDAYIEDVRWEPAAERLRLSLLTLDPPSRYQRWP